MKERFAHVISVAFAAALVSICGCSTRITWTEDKGVNRNELVKVTGDWEPKYKVFIVKVDEKRLRNNVLTGLNQTAYLKPGQHTLVVGYEHRMVGPGINGEGESRAFQKLKFIAQAGKSYAIHRKLDGYQITFWIDEL